MFVWEEKRVRFYRDAAQKVGFCRTIAEHAGKYLLPQDRICDAGCGLGFLSVELLKYCAHVTAVDCSEQAVSFLRSSVTLEQAKRMTVLEEDMRRLPEEMKFDVMCFCFFGSHEEITDLIRRHCTRTALIIKKEGSGRRFDIRNRTSSRLLFSEEVRALEKSGFSFAAETFQLEMGQPFRSLEDAAEFLRCYGGLPEETGQMPEKIQNRLIQTEDPEFPFYLPAEREVGIAAVDCTAMVR